MSEDQTAMGCSGTIIISVPDQPEKQYAVGFVFAETETIGEVLERTEKVLRTAHLKFRNNGAIHLGGDV